MMNKTTVYVCVLIMVSVLVTGYEAKAQNAFEDAIQQLSSENVQGYLQPMLDGFGANLNSGLIGSARIPDGFRLQIRISGMATVIGKSQQTYMATPPLPYPQSSVETATIFGGTGSVLNGPSGMQYTFQNGQIKTDIMPFAIPQITVGNFFGTQAIIRYVPVPSIEDFPDVSFFGIGVRHSISRYIPESPVDIAAGLFYQTLTIGDILTAKAVALNAQASKTLSVVTFYGGLQYETLGVELDYRYTGPLPSGDTSSRDVSLSFGGQNKFRIAAGLGVSLGIVHITGDINIGKVTVFCVGLGFGI
jgi:hypothetical protein